MHPTRLLPVVLLTLAFAGGARLAAGRLEDGFRQPPPSTRPWCYWYWISDHLSREGITRDLEAMARVGIGEAFIGNIFLEDAPPGPVKVLTDGWWQLVEHAIREGARVGVDLGLFNCPGWSQSGGPWIQPSDAMRYLVSAEVRVVGPRLWDGVLPTPVAPFQQVAVQAFPAPLADAATSRAQGAQIESTPAVEGWERLIDGAPSTWVALPERAARGRRDWTLDVAFPQPVTVRSLALRPGPSPWSAQAELRVADAGGVFRPVRAFRFDRSNMNIGVGPMPRGPVTVAFPAQHGQRFQLVLSAISGQAELAELDLSGAARLEAFVEKQLGKMHPTPLPMGDAYRWPASAEPETPSLRVDPAQVIDLTAQTTPDGRLVWSVPAGDWILLRTGLTPTGTKNAPASPEGQGLEVDKMNRAAAGRHFEAFIGQLLRRMPARDRRAFRHVVADSYEMGSQNWTEGFEEAFHHAYGYSPRPWLPVLTGRLVGSADQSERFLWDLRRLVADRVATEYVGGLREQCRDHGLELWLENYGHWGFPSEFLKYGSQSDRIGGEFWITGDLGAIELRAASSCVNTYGMPPVVSAEAFTGGPPFRTAPWGLKARGDWAFCEGVNHFVLHVYIHQPWEDRRPGVNAWFGTEFNRHNTWFEPSRAWIDYLRRCGWLLQQGVRVADVAYFIGEDTPKMTGERQPALPPGHDFDFLNAEVLLQRLRVRDGQLSLPHGVAYRLLVLPDQDTMRPAVLRRIHELLRAGATVVGPPPSRSPSLQHYPASDQEVARLARDLWGPHPGPAGERGVGRGRLVWGRPLAEVLAAAHVPPDFQNSEGLLFTHRRDARTDFYFVANPHPRALTTTVGFRAGSRAPELWWPDSGTLERPAVYDSDAAIVRLPLTLGPHGSVFVVFRDRARPDRIVAVTRDGRPLLSTYLAPAKPRDGAQDSQAAASEAPAAPRITQDARGRLQAVGGAPGTYQVRTAQGRLATLDVSPPPPIPLDGPWQVHFDPAAGGPGEVRFTTLDDWSQRPEPAIRHYAGRAVYRTSVHLPAPTPGQPPARALLELGHVRDLAVVRVNGLACGTLWMAPWRADITQALRAGENTVEVDIINVWNNRLVADAAQATTNSLTFLITPTVKQDDPLLPAGLLGPVTLRQEPIQPVPTPALPR